MRRARTGLRVTVAISMAISALAGCHNPQAGGLTIAGSTSVQPVAEMLADKYMAEHPGHQINVQGGGSSAGISAVLSGAAAIGMSSRELKPDETGLTRFLLARDAIALIVHPDNPVHEMTTEQARGIFSGRIRRWDEIGGRAARITCITREEGSGTRSAFEEMIMGEDVQIAADAIVQDSTGAARTIVADDRNAIAYVSLGMVTPEVTAVTLDGVKPTHETVESGKYRLCRPFLLLTKGPPSPEAQAYLDYVRRPDCQAIIAEEGYIPVKSGDAQ
ncbi:MAG: phosphate ABC transporter substrate-binding protein [Armatimonadetes bacterium]|nr:phosphate ABC transporter substrate-binding protein [Armatimonadota bacterium]